MNCRIFNKMALGAIISSACCSTATASLTFTMIGQPGSGTFNYEATGSMTVDVDSVDGLNSSTGRLPLINNGDWTSSWSTNSGNFISDFTTSLHQNLGLSGGGVSVSVGGTVIGQWDTFDFIPSATSGGDDVRPDPTGTIPYPTVTRGTVVSWSGSGTITLNNAEPNFDAFDEVFTVGTYIRAINSTDDYIINIQSIPEPSTALLSGLALLGLLRRRR